MKLGTISFTRKLQWLYILMRSLPIITGVAFVGAHRASVYTNIPEAPLEVQQSLPTQPENDILPNFSFGELDVARYDPVASPYESIKGDVHSFKVKFKDIPESFDAAEEWPECTMIGYARDQGNCGSCWAFAAAGVANDRICIHHVQKQRAGEIPAGKSVDPRVFKFLSAGHLTTCSKAGSCLGGRAVEAYSEIMLKGLPTGGDFEEEDSGETCKPYMLHPCAHHVEGSPLPDCTVSDIFPDGQETPACSSQCGSNKYPLKLEDDMLQVSGEDLSPFDLAERIMQSIMQHGPVSASMFVQEDFPSYKGGIYTPRPGAAVLGGHAIKVTGWGVEDGVPFWRCVNSWGPAWGEGGGFRVDANFVLRGFSGPLAEKL